MRWKPNAGKEISKLKSDFQIRRYRKNNFGNTNSNYFGRGVFEELLADPDVVGITVIYGMSKDSESSSAELSTFSVSIDEAEFKTGLDFYPSLEDTEEAEIECNMDTGQWYWK